MFHPLSFRLSLVPIATICLLQAPIYPHFNAQSTKIDIAQAQTNPARRRIAVLDFDFASTGLTGAGLGVASAYGSYGPAKGVSDLLTNKLVQDGTFIVIERSKIDQILKEQNLGASGRVDASTAAQIGRILGVDVVIIGSITKFNLEQKNSGGFGIFGVSVSDSKASAIVQLSARLVSTTTAEILAVAEGEGQAVQKDGRVFVLGVGGGSDTSNNDTLLSGAAEQAVNQLVTGIAANATKIATLPSVQPGVNAVVADITGGLITLNRGTNDGYQAGMKLTLERVVKKVLDPSTGEVLRIISQPVGQMVITEADAKSSLGRMTSGVNIQVGDVAKP